MSHATTRTVRWTGAPVEARTGETLVIALPEDPEEGVTERRADMRLWLPGKADLPDAFTLVGELPGTDGVTEEVYRLPRTVEDADAHIEGGALYSLVFSDEAGAVEGASVPPTDRAVRYRLVHHPGGLAVGGEREVAWGLHHNQVFQYGPGERAAGLDRKQFAGFVATRFYAGDALAFPDDLRLHGPSRLASVPDTLRAPTTAAERPVVWRGRVWQLGRAGGGIDGDEAADAAANDGVPADEIVAAPRTGATADGGAAPEAPPPPLPPPEPLGPELADAPTWLTLVARSHVPVTGGEAGVDLLGTWEVQPGTGAYRYAVYPEAAASEAPTPDAADARLPSAAGDAAPYVLVPTREVSESGGRAVAAWVLPIRLPRAAAQAFGAAALEDDLARIAFGPAGSDGTLVTAETSARYDEGMWKVYLPDAVRVTRRLVRHAEAAQAQFQAWSEASADASTNATTIATAAYDTSHRRTYLAERLVETRGPITQVYSDPNGGLHSREVQGPTRDPRINMAVAWKGFRPSQTGLVEADPSPIGTSDLSQAVYGYHMQELYLRHRRLVAGRRLEAWLHRTMVAAVFPALATAGPEDAESASACGEALAEGIGEMAACGAGRALVYGLWKDTLAQAEALDIESFGALVEPLEAAATGPWDAFLGEKPFKSIWTVLRKGTSASSKFLKSLPPVLLLTVDPDAPIQYVKLTGDKAKAVAGLFAGWSNELPHGGPSEGARARHRAGSSRSRPRGAPRLPRTLSGAPFQVVRTTPHFPAEGYTFGDTGISLRRAVRDAQFTETFSRGGRPIPGEQYQLHYFGSPIEQNTPEAVRRNASQRLAGAQVGRVKAYLDAVNVAVNLAAFGRGASSGELSFGDAVSLAKAVAGIGGVLEDFGPEQALRLGKALKTAGPWFEVVGATWSAAQALDDTDPFGAQDVPEVDGAQFVAAVASGAGGALLSFAGGTVAVAGVPLMVVGFVLIGIGVGVAWWAEAKETEARKLADPLYHWLPTGSVWGRATAGAERARLLALAAPGWGRPPAPGTPATPGAPERLEGETAAFAREAFVFPVSVEPREEAQQGRTVVTGLTLRIDPHYVPLAGTLRLSVSVQVLDSTDRPIRGQGVKIERVVHYVRAGRAFRYRTVREGAPLAVSDDLAAQAAREGWAASESHEVRVARPLPSGAPRDARAAVVTETHAVLPVRLGPVWHARDEALDLPWSSMRQAIDDLRAAGHAMPTRNEVESARDAAVRERARVLREARAAGGVDGDGLVTFDGGDAEGEKAARTLAEQEAADAQALAAALASGRFRVSGFCVFDPAQPLAPGADVPEVAPAPGDARASEPVGGPDGYTYPPTPIRPGSSRPDR